MSELSRDPMRQSLRALTHGVYVLSTRAEQLDTYLIVSLAMQCSVQPPRIAFALTPNARIAAAIRFAGGGIISVLNASQLAAVRRYGAPGSVKHAPPSPERDASGFSIPPEASYAISFRLAQEFAVGDHTMFIVDAVAARVMHPDALAPALLDTQSTRAQPFAAMILTATGFPYAG